MNSILISIALCVAISAAAPSGEYQQLGTHIEVRKSVDSLPFNCTDPDIDCNANGRCATNKQKCICNNGYVTHDSNDGTQCNYKQMSRFAPFFTELFVGFLGVGYFVLGETALGIGQLFLFIGPLILLCIFMCLGAACGEDGVKAGAGAGYCLFAMCIIGGFAWWLYAVIGMGTGSITDSNGVDTYW